MILLSVTQLPPRWKICGFASPPHDGFAFIVDSTIVASVWPWYQVLSQVQEEGEQSLTHRRRATTEASWGGDAWPSSCWPYAPTLQALWSSETELEDLCRIKEKASGIWRGNVMCRWLNLPCTILDAESNIVVTDTLRSCCKLAYSELCTPSERDCMESPQVQANRLTIRRLMAAYTNASPLAHNLS